MHSPPRPILKTSPSPKSTTALPFPSARGTVCGSLHVHFPPTPTMTQTDLTHSAISYDRKPIIVLPNACALPGRGERDVDAFPEPECDLELWALAHRKKKRSSKAAYFRAYETIEPESSSSSSPDGNDLLEQFSSLSSSSSSSSLSSISSSLLFARNSSSSSLSSPYRVQNDTLRDDNNNNNKSHVRSVQFVAGTLDTSDAPSECSTPGSFYINASMDACQFIQNIPHMDLSLPFMPRKQPRVRNNKSPQARVKTCPFTPPKKMSTTTPTTPPTTPTTMTTPTLITTPTPTTRATSSSNHFERTRKAVYNAGCGGFSSGLYESGLDGCLGGF